MADPLPPSPPSPGPAPETPLDAGSQALSDALRSSFTIVKYVMGLLVAVFLASGFFTVGPQERAIILRFGKPVAQGPKALLEPGFHWSLPYPIDEVVRVSISGLQQVRSTVGWYATTPEQELAGTEPPPGGTLNPAVDGYVLTADNNIVHTRATLTYRIDDPIQYVFSFVNASNAVQNALDNALVQVASRFKVDDLLTREVLAFREAVRDRAMALAAERKLGIVVDQCVIQSAPPRQLKDAFASVLKAELKRSQVLSEARSYENQVVSKSSADAASHIFAAESERTRLVNDISSRADQFQRLLPKYLANPSLFTRQRLTETLGRVFTNVQDKIFLTESADGKPKELRLLLNREPPKKAEEPKP